MTSVSAKTTTPRAPLYLLHTGADGLQFHRVADETAAYQFALYSQIGFEYDRFERHEHNDLLDRCAAVSPSLVENLSTSARSLLNSTTEAVVFYAHLPRGGVLPAYAVAREAEAPRAGQAAMSYLAHYRHNVLHAQLDAFDDAVLEKAQTCREFGLREALLQGLRRLHRTLLLERGVRAVLDELVNVGDSVLLIRTVNHADFTLWLSDRELRQWIRDRQAQLRGEGLIIEVQLPDVLAGQNIDAHPAPVKLVVHVSESETIVFSHPKPRVVPPRRPAIPTAAACQRLGDNVMPLRRPRARGKPPRP